MRHDFVTGTCGPTTWPAELNLTRVELKNKLAKSIAESMSTESDSFSNYLAVKIMREFNVTPKGK